MILGLSKLQAGLIAGISLVATLFALYFLIYNHGVNDAGDKVQSHNVEVIDNSAVATGNAMERFMNSTVAIDNQTEEVKEVIHEAPASSINSVSRARLERVRQQQSSVSKDSR